MFSIFNKKKIEEREMGGEIPEPSFSPSLFPVFSNSNNPMGLSAVYRAVEIISDSIATLPIKVMLKDEKNYQNLNGHYLNLIFKSNTDRLTKYNFVKLLIQSVLLKGNGYAYIERGENGKPKSLRFLPSSDVVINYNKQNNSLTYTCSLVSKKVIQPEDMIHLVKNSYDGINGVSVLTYAKRLLDTAQSTENSANSFFSNGCNVAGVITSKSLLNGKQKEQIRTGWISQAGTNGHYSAMIGVLDGGLDFKPLQVNAKDAQMLESRQWNVQDIARFFGISPVLLGDLSKVSFSSLEAVQQDFLLHTLQPYIIMVEEEFTRKLIGNEKNVEINLDESAMLRTDKQAQANYYSTLLDKGILSINEVRKELGYSEIEGGDKHIIAYTDISQNTINKDKEEKEDE